RLDEMARPFRRLFTNLTRPSVERVDTGYSLSSWLDNDKGGLATSVMPLRLPYCSARNEESKKKKLLLLSNHACGGYRGKDLRSLSCKRRTLLALYARCDVVYRVISYTSDWR